MKWASTWVERVSMRLSSWSAVVAWIVILVSGAVLWFRFPLGESIRRSPVPGDFSLFFKAWERARLGENPYLADSVATFHYSPGILTFMGVLPGSSPEAGWFAFGTISIVALMLALLVGARYRSWTQVVALILGLAFAWKGILATMDYGQLELVILCLAVLSTLLLRRVPSVSGFLAGTLPWIKLPWLLLAFPLVVVLLSRRGTKLSGFFSGYFAACFAWGAAIPALVFGSDRAMELSQAWFHMLRDQPLAFYLDATNQSLWTSAVRWVETLGYENLFLGLGAVGVLAGWILGRMTQKTTQRSSQPQFSPLAAIGPWLILVQLVNPLSWWWGSVHAVAIPFSALAGAGESGEVKRGPLRVSLWILALALWMLQIGVVGRQLGFDPAKDYFSHGAGTIWWLALLLLSI